MTASERESDGGAHRDRASASLGREGTSPRVTEFRDWPVAKSCVPPYVPVRVDAMVKRQG
jgi:hypothetical protein